MRLLIFCTSYWDWPGQAEQQSVSLNRWCDHVEHYFPGCKKLVACGHECDLSLNPLRGRAECIHSGIKYSKPYDVFWQCYFLCGFEAALWHALFREDWDLLVEIENDCFINNVDVPKRVEEFAGRSELILAPQWCGRPDPNFLVLKREGVARFVHGRLRPNLSKAVEKPMLNEEELKAIFEDCWWNPWSELLTIRQEYGNETPHMKTASDSDAKKWPVVRMPSPAVWEHIKSL